VTPVFETLKGAMVRLDARADMLRDLGAEVVVADMLDSRLAHLVAHLVVMAQLHRDNRYDRMTHTFQQLVGRAPMSAAEFARRHAAAFAPG
jgi:hypothetical protein